VKHANLAKVWHQQNLRKQDKKLVAEIHADFIFISQGMEVGTEELC